MGPYSLIPKSLYLGPPCFIVLKQLFRVVGIDICEALVITTKNLLFPGLEALTNTKSAKLKSQAQTYIKLCVMFAHK